MTLTPGRIDSKKITTKIYFSKIRDVLKNYNVKKEVKHLIEYPIGGR